MKRVDADGHVANLFEDKDAQGGLPGTLFEKTWHNNVQEEIVSVIENQGIALNGNIFTQLDAAISLKIINESLFDHGQLGGLADDDHPQYILASGARAFTGPASMGNNRINNVLDPAVAQDAATKNYVDSLQVGTSRIRFTADVNGGTIVVLSSNNIAGVPTLVTDDNNSGMTFNIVFNNDFADANYIIQGTALGVRDVIASRYRQQIISYSNVQAGSIDVNVTIHEDDNNGNVNCVNSDDNMAYDISIICTGQLA
ncbi:MAG: hypothetical protein COX62_01410 [Deltaproteobacteria bacterium CG_4_10_14_0_2_um_filter_43_8]|nr:MAG: hypothetical protein COV43_04430 [Deltaproteobacteria bacterium CG11_big_fil_rev_8_21_14_0_20_42_23]PJA21810.1 MAG: hypothetical protein COX62_01410 [Deltaproteobacteria bacterium CG_4_10_14_0_2_um_filter_43_8]PJC65021.1 MAG: hypothetical protein CO021_00820 [Deltaproteobacteria bacterium CG_4_9_14_0_2_um_filter_42_21]